MSELAPPLEDFCLPLLQQKIDRLTKELDDAVLRLSDASECEKYLRDTLAEANKENDKLRGILAASKLPCIYCGLEDMGLCRKGFPGCARADDLMVNDAILTNNKIRACECGVDDACALTKERDEALAEVSRLKATIATINAEMGNKP